MGQRPCIARRVNGYAAGKRDQPPDAHPDIVVFVVACLHRFHPGKAEIEGFVLAVHQGVHMINDAAPFVPVFDQSDGVMVLMTVGHEDQVGGQVISFPRVGIDIDDLPFSGNDAKTSVPLIEQSL